MIDFILRLYLKHKKYDKKEENKMKKVLATILVLTLVLASVSFAFAESHNSLASPITENKDVKVNVTSKTGGGTVYKIDIAWDSMNFTYSKGANDTWDPVDHRHEGSVAAHFEGTNTANITVTNHSNASVQVNAAFAGDQVSAESHGITATLSDVSEPEGDRKSPEQFVTLLSDDDSVNGEGTCPDRIFKVTVEVTDSSALVEGENTIGTITVTVKQ